MTTALDPVHIGGGRSNGDSYLSLPLETITNYQTHIHSLTHKHTHVKPAM